MNKTTNETVQSMQHLDSLKAVKVAMDMNKAQDKTIDKLIDLVASMDKNMKLLAVKVLELEKDRDILFELIKGQEKTIQSLEGYANREI